MGLGVFFNTVNYFFIEDKQCGIYNVMTHKVVSMWLCGNIHDPMFLVQYYNIRIVWVVVGMNK
jgi:hypothetical protein